MANILSDNLTNFSVYNPHETAKQIAQRLREKRLALNLTQLALAKKAGVSLGSLKRFESSYEISLHHLILLAIALQVSEDFERLFTSAVYQSVDDVIKQKSVIRRKRGRKNV